MRIILWWSALRRPQKKSTKYLVITDKMCLFSALQRHMVTLQPTKRNVVALTACFRRCHATRHGKIHGVLSNLVQGEDCDPLSAELLAEWNHLIKMTRIYYYLHPSMLQSAAIQSGSTCGFLRCFYQSLCHSCLSIWDFSLITKWVCCC